MVAKQKVHCPHCERTFLTNAGLGIHVSRRHGIPGTSYTALKNREQKQPVADRTEVRWASTLIEAAAADQQRAEEQPADQQVLQSIPSDESTTKVLPNETGQYVCQECSESYTSPAALGRHRRFRHGVIGKYTRQLENKKLERDVHEGNGNKGHAIQRQHNTAAPESKEVYVAGQSIDPIAFALAIGSIKEFCRHFAEEHGVPTRQFTRQCAELFLREARR